MSDFAQYFLLVSTVHHVSFAVLIAIALFTLLLLLLLSLLQMAQNTVRMMIACVSTLYTFKKACFSTYKMEQNEKYVIR